MVTIRQEKTESTISSEALGLLDCFSGGVEDFVYKLAEHAANSKAAASSGVVEISADDVEKAADFLVEAIRRSEIPSDLRPAINGMLSCFTDKITQRKR